MKVLIIGIIFLTSLIYSEAQVLQNTDNSSVKFRNKIDEIKNDADIDKLLESINKKQFEVFIVKENLEIKNQKCRELAESVQAKSWTKADFDNNGYTDILIIGDNYGLSSIVILDKGNNNFEIKALTKGIFPSCSFPVVQNKKPQPVIFYYTDESSEAHKTLIYKFGDFVEINDSPKTHRIEEIEYKTSGCFGTCPIFELTIDSNHQAVYKPIAFNKKKKGTFKGTIRSFEYDELVGLLNYIDFADLRDSYSVNWTDDQSSFLSITYDDGKVKKINDYGLIGTFGLSRVYKILFDLRENQSWK
jgi:hypothetical protein